MLLLHEGLQEEAAAIQEAVAKAYGIRAEAVDRDLSSVFPQTKNVRGFGCPYPLTSRYREFGIQEGKKAMVLTRRDMYANDSSQEDDWVFGGCFSDGRFFVVSTARLGGHTSELASQRVSSQTYLRRVAAVGVHEIGHDVVKAGHFRQAAWVNAETGENLPLGPHCTDNSCIMYEAVDLKPPAPEKGFLLLGDERKYDAGLDEILVRVPEGWLCKGCKDSVSVGDGYD